MTDILTLTGVTSASSLGILLPAFKVVQQMAATYEHIKLGQKRCKVVIQRAALIIKEVNSDLRDDPASVLGVAKLQRELEAVQAILQKLADMSFFKALLHFEDINNEIERANRLLDDCSQLFPIRFSSHVQQAQTVAEVSDRDALRALLKILAGNYEEIRRRFSLYRDEQEDLAMAVLERELRNARITPDAPVEVQIMQRSLECIKTTTGRSAPKQNKWLIAEYDLDFCGTIGGGGFSTVSKAHFRGTLVAVKSLKNVGNTRSALEREIEIWSRLRHDHIVPFYGACTLTSPPYTVSRYMQNGNLVQYLITTPNADRKKLIFEVSLGMYYLHEENIVHGDLKGVNVLVDDSGKACITDFGLSKVRFSGTAQAETSKIVGTLRFLAPEAVKGHPLSFETDVYAFGMLIYEVFTGEVPFIMELDDSVREGIIELRRPTSGAVYERGFNDAFWQLLCDCTSREPSTRPRFKTIQTRFSSIKNADQTTPLIRREPTPGAEDKNLTDWGLASVTSSCPSPPPINNTAPLPETGKSASVEQHGGSVLHEIKALPPILPMCIVVTHKYFGVKFGASSGRPDVLVNSEEGSKTQRRLIRVERSTLLREEANRFWYRSGVGNGENSWALDGNDVTLRTASTVGVCHFRDAQMAQKWFRLQLSYVRDGLVNDSKTMIGDWSETKQSWRRLIHGKIQHANLIEGAPKAVPTDHSWGDANLPKRFTIDKSAGTESRIVCITNPGKEPGRLCCKLERCRIVFETYRHTGQSPVDAREETYPSEEYAEVTFDVLKAVLGKAAQKNNKWNFLSF